MGEPSTNSQESTQRASKSVGRGVGDFLSFAKHSILFLPSSYSSVYIYVLYIIYIYIYIYIYLSIYIYLYIYIYLEAGINRYLIYWQLGAWFQICRELEDQGYIKNR